MLKFKRLSTGNYLAECQAGRCEITLRDDKWYIDFPDGKKSYRQTYKAAKAWADKYISRLEEKPVQSKIKKAVTEVKPPTLKEKLTRENAYVVGVEPTNCFNSGVAACIVHIIVENKSYYTVGQEGDILDTLIEKAISKTKKLISRGIVQDYVCQNKKIIKVFKDFAAAEKCYQDMDNKMREENRKDRERIQSVKDKVRNNTATVEDYFALSDYGVI